MIRMAQGGCEEGEQFLHFILKFPLIYITNGFV